MATTNKDVMNSWMIAAKGAARNTSNRKNNEEVIIENSKSKYVREKEAIRDMNTLLGLLNNSLNGSFNEADKELFQEYREQWLESIKVLREYINNNLD